MKPSLSAREARIPVHVITGFLGSGKSSLIRRLIDQKPRDERWAVVVNEFGQVGIDQTLFEAREDIVIKALPGGCLCCQLAFVLQASLVNLLRRSRPDRLIIEPSGLGHPAGLLDMLQGEAFDQVLEVRSVTALLDPRRLSDPRAREHETFRGQLLMADGVALTMTDLIDDEARMQAYRHLDGMWPPKRWISEAPHGRLDSELVLGEGTEMQRLGGLPPVGHERAKEPPLIELDALTWREPVPGRPVRDSHTALGYASQSWRWSAQDRFSLDALTRVLDSLASGLRIKGVWHTDGGWRLYNRGDGRAELAPSTWRHDSRLEVIAEPGQLADPEVLEAELVACLVGRQPE